MRYGRDVELTSAMLDDATDGYSPCPQSLVDILKTWVIPSDYRGTLFDNCAGDGFAAHSLAQAWGLRPILVEPHTGRHNLCRRYDRSAICAPAQRVVGRGPTVWFFNPPYDLEDETGSMERHLLWRSVARVPAPQTFCVWLVPRRMVNDPFFVGLLNRQLTELRVFKLGPPWEDYRQIAVMGYWAQQPERSADSHGLLSNVPAALPILDLADGPYSVKTVGMNFSAKLESTPVSSDERRENLDLRNFAKGAV